MDDQIKMQIDLSLDEQLALLDKHGTDAMRTLLCVLMGNSVKIQELARQRLTEGFDLYRSEMFHKTPEELRTELMEELADAVNYLLPGYA